MEKDTNTKNEKYRKLPVAALVTGILGIAPMFLYNILWMPISMLLRSVVDESFIPNIILPFIACAICLSIAAVVCGSIDLGKIKKGISSSKGRGFDIAGIVMGGIVIIFAVIFMLGEIFFPH